MNKRNYSQSSNYMCGTSTIDLLPFYVQTVNVPGVNFSLPEVSGRFGSRLMMNSDSVTFNGISMDIIMDEDYQIYKDIMKIIFDRLNVETGTFADFSFDFWVETTDDMGKSVLKWEFYGCRIESVGDLMLDSKDDDASHTFSLDLRFDYYKIITPGAGVPSLS